jgi:hypothetical protein
MKFCALSAFSRKLGDMATLLFLAIVAYLAYRFPLQFLATLGITLWLLWEWIKV